MRIAAVRRPRRFVYLWHVNPELIAARRGFGACTKNWDFVMIAILIAGTAVLLWVAGFDERYHWSPLPAW